MFGSYACLFLSPCFELKSKEGVLFFFFLVHIIICLVTIDLKQHSTESNGLCVCAGEKKKTSENIVFRGGEDLAIWQQVGETEWEYCFGEA